MRTLRHHIKPNEHITQEWQLIVNTLLTAMIENQRFLQQKLALQIIQIKHPDTTKI